VNARVWLLGAFVVAALAGCGQTREETEPGGSPPIEVRVTAVRRGEVVDVRTVTGQTAALTMVRLASPVTGRVTFLAAQPGDRLEKGAIAARVLPSENEAAVHGFDILERSGSLTPEERKLGRDLRRTQVAGDVALRAPFAAVVSARLHNPGEQVAPNDVLLELFDPSSLYVVAQVPIEIAAQMRPGMEVQVVSGAGRASGRVAVIMPALDARALTVPTRVELSEPLPLPLLSAAVECRITLAHHGDVLVVPRSALLSSIASKRGEVMVAAGKRAEARAVSIGLHNDQVVEITEGLAAGEMVLVDGQYALPEGAAIQPKPDAG
jgi:HlyD family secretion protein